MESCGKRLLFTQFIHLVWSIRFFLLLNFLVIHLQQISIYFPLKQRVTKEFQMNVTQINNTLTIVTHVMYFLMFVCSSSIGTQTMIPRIFSIADQTGTFRKLYLQFKRTKKLKNLGEAGHFASCAIKCKKNGMFLVSRCK